MLSASKIQSQGIIMKTNADLLGKGIAFPPRIDGGRVAWSSGEDNVRESIRVLLLTQNNERLHLAAFGGDLSRFLYEPNTAAIRHQMEERIKKALTDWEPRISVESVTAAQSGDDPGAATVTIAYRLVATQQAERVSLTVPLQG
jgi:phage baseplate assembly protein W